MKENYFANGKALNFNFAGGYPQQNKKNFKIQ